ncbi:hypothetical protein ACJX0J_007555, partial [Zea mays]
MDNMNLQGWEEILKRDFSILIVEYISLLYKNKGPKMNLQGWEEILKRDFSIFIKNQSNKQYKNKGPKMNHQHIYGVLGKMVITDLLGVVVKGDESSGNIDWYGVIKKIIALDFPQGKEYGIIDIDKTRFDEILRCRCENFNMYLICLPRLFELYLNIIDQEGTT